MGRKGYIKKKFSSQKKIFQSFVHNVQKTLKHNWTDVEKYVYRVFINITLSQPLYC